jgi:hypothetical protein
LIAGIASQSLPKLLLSLAPIASLSLSPVFAYSRQ